ncbi:MAG: RnfH family protein [Steroidobacteraceae bacterium]
MTVKCCQVVAAQPDAACLVSVSVPAAANVSQVIELARQSPGGDRLPQDFTAIAIFGQVVDADHVPADGDRVELLRPLALDPREQRRRRVLAGRRRRR